MSRRFRLVAWLAAVAMYAGSSALLSAERPLVVVMVANSDGVTFSITNVGDQALSVLRWDTPLEPVLSSDVFSIGDGDVNFTGRHIKRAYPLERDYIQLQAGETVSADVVLNRFYDVVDHASYEVSYNGVISYSALVGSVSASAKHSARQSMDMSAAKVMVELAPAAPIARAQVPGFLSCSVDRQALISTALDASAQLTIEARDALANLPVSQRATSPRYLQWFGSYTATRYSQVQSGMTNAANVMANQVIDFDCSCDEGAYAYVFTNDPFRVYLCRAFWSAPNTGTDSKAGTILHELSHFPQVKGTDDHAYGQTAAAALARTDPDRAINNADSFEYFMENTPALPMQGDGTTAPAPEPDNYIPLAPGTSIAGSVQRGDSILYQSDGASVLNLTTNNGDADLFVYSDAARIDELCNSRETTTLDSCDLGSAQDVFIRVEGYETSTFTLAVIGTEVGGQTDGGSTDGSTDGSATDGEVTDGGDGGFAEGPPVDTQTGSSGGSGGGGGGLGVGLLGLLLAGVRRATRAGLRQ